MKHFITVSVASLVGCLFVGSVLKAEAEAAGYKAERASTASVRAVASMESARDCAPDSSYWTLFAAAAAAE